MHEYPKVHEYPRVYEYPSVHKCPRVHKFPIVCEYPRVYEKMLGTFPKDFFSLGSCRLGICHFGSHPRENAFGKVPNTYEYSRVHEY